MGVEPASVRLCVRQSMHALTLSNMNISATSGPIVKRFHGWFRGRVVCALNYKAGDPGSIPGSGGLHTGY